MRLITATFADFLESPTGGPSQLDTPLGGSAVLAHTLKRVAHIGGADEHNLIVRPRDQERAAARLEQLGLSDHFHLLAIDDGARPRGVLLRTARKWSLDAWRGGLLGTTWFDEYLDARMVSAAMQLRQARAVLALDAHQAALDPDIATRMLTHYRANHEEAHFVFTQAPPGLAGVLLDAEAIADLLELNVPLGMLLAYHPEIPQGDPITKPPCLHIDRAIAQSSGRWVADTRRARERLAAAFAELGEDADALALCRREAAAAPEPLPIEIELELTTRDPLPDTTLRPRGARVPLRELADWEALTRVARELATYDDRRVWLGGHGDPLEHPRLAEICRILREAGIFALGLETTLRGLTQPLIETLFAAPVDVLQVRLDANCEATYQAVHGAGGFERLAEQLHELMKARADRGNPRPIIVPSLTRCSRTLADLEPFYDRWIRATGAATITGYSRYAGLLPADGLIALTPPVREPCRRLSTSLCLLADGTATACNQDALARQPLGNWFVTPLDELWSDGPRRKLVEAHAGASLATLPVCANCTEWFRAI